MTLHPWLAKTASNRNGWQEATLKIRPVIQSRQEIEPMTVTLRGAAVAWRESDRTYASKDSPLDAIEDGPTRVETGAGAEASRSIQAARRSYR